MLRRCDAEDSWAPKLEIGPRKSMRQLHGAASSPPLRVKGGNAWENLNRLEMTSCSEFCREKEAGNSSAVES